MAAIMAAIMEITENIMRRMHEPSTKLHNALYFMSGMMVVILALVIVAGVKTKAENAGFHIADDTENSYEQQVAGQADRYHTGFRSGKVAGGCSCLSGKRVSV